VILDDTLFISNGGRRAVGFGVVAGTCVRSGYAVQVSGSSVLACFSSLTAVWRERFT